MGDLLQGLVLFLIFSPIFFVIGACALGYYASIMKPSDETIHKFLEELNFPANWVYYKSKYNILAGMGGSSVQYIKKATRFGSIIGIMGYSIVPIIFIVGILAVISKGGNARTGLFWIVVELISYLFSLRFGSKLRRMKQSKVVPPIS